MDILWNGSNMTDIEHLEMRLIGFAILRFMDSIIANSDLLQPKWFRYTLVTPLSVIKLHSKFPDIALYKISLEGFEHKDKFISNE